MASIGTYLGWKDVGYQGNDFNETPNLDRLAKENITLADALKTAGYATGIFGKVLDGESLLPLFKGDNMLKREAIFWHFPGYLNEPVIRGRERGTPVAIRSLQPRGFQPCFFALLFSI